MSWKKPMSDRILVPAPREKFASNEIETKNVEFISLYRM
mgnify:CR=1 FL=1